MCYAVVVGRLGLLDEHGMPGEANQIMHVLV